MERGISSSEYKERERSRMGRVEKLNDGRLWLDETVGFSESDVVVLWKMVIPVLGA
jgi:hypothetical protein